MTAILLSILCYSTGHSVLGTVSLIYGIIKCFCRIIVILAKLID